MRSANGVEQLNFNESGRVVSQSKDMWTFLNNLNLSYSPVHVYLVYLSLYITKKWYEVFWFSWSVSVRCCPGEQISLIFFSFPSDWDTTRPDSLKFSCSTPFRTSHRLVARRRSIYRSIAFRNIWYRLVWSSSIFPNTNIHRTAHYDGVLVIGAQVPYTNWSLSSGVELLPDSSIWPKMLDYAKWRL